MRISAREVYELGLIDEVLPEPTGGAHRNYQETAQTLKAAILRHLADLKQLSPEDLIEKRYQKFRKVGRYSTLCRR